MTEAPTPVEVFCCYANADELWLRKLEIHLSLLKRQGLISLWHDRQILPGTDWTETINRHLETASVILLLVSADFLASDYCYSIEMKHAIEREAEGSARIIPILVRPVDWRSAPFAHLQPLPTDTKPIETWENQETALANVAAGIRRVIVEELPQISTSASRAALPAIWNIPYPRNPFFLGRDTELAQVCRHLQAGQVTALSQPQAISGLGGIGKTQLALEYAYRYRSDYQAVLWATASSTEALVSSYLALAALLQLPEHEAKEQDIIVQAVKTWLRTHRGWLLILDNADDLALVPEFLPPVMGGHLLLTTRAQAMGRLASRVEVKSLSPEQGALFLLRRAALLASHDSLEDAAADFVVAKAICKNLGGLPLALDQAGAYIEETRCSLADYQNLYRTRRTEVLNSRGGLINDHPEPVTTTWSLSFEKVEQKTPATADLLRFCSFLHPDAIPEEIITAGAECLGPLLQPMASDPLLLNKALAALGAYSLISRDATDKTLSVHRLVQAVVKDAMDEGSRRDWAQRAVLAVHKALPKVEFTTWLQCERYLPHALVCSELIKQENLMQLEAASLLCWIGVYLHDREQDRDVETLLVRALEIYEQQLGSDHLDTANSLGNLASLYYSQGKYEEAERLFRRALSIQERQLGPDHLVRRIVGSYRAYLIGTGTDGKFHAHLAYPKP